MRLFLHHSHAKIRALISLFYIALFVLLSLNINAQPVWQSNLDSEIKFYQTTDFGILLVGTSNSLYGIDGKTGQRLWRRNHCGLDETSITPVPGTDLILFINKITYS